MKLTNALGETLTIERQGWTIMITSEKDAEPSAAGLYVKRQHEKHAYFTSIGWVLNALRRAPERRIKL